MKLTKKLIKEAIEKSRKPRLGPGFFVNGNKKMMMLTPPINTFLYGLDQTNLTTHTNSNLTEHDSAFSNLFSSTLISLIADILNYIQNRIYVTIGKKVSIRSIPEAKAKIKKYLNGIDIKTLIGEKGYQELKKLDEIRGSFQHSNERYFGDYQVNNYAIRDGRELKKYVFKIKNIIVELDEKLEKINPTYHQEISEVPGKTTITTKAIGHSFDIENMKININEAKPLTSEEKEEK